MDNTTRNPERKDTQQENTQNSKYEQHGPTKKPRVNSRVREG